MNKKELYHFLPSLVFLIVLGILALLAGLNIAFRVARAFAGRVGEVPPVVLAGEPFTADELTAWLVR